MDQLALQTFGFPVLRIGDRAVEMALLRALALLVRLGHAKSVVSRDALAGLLWPEADTGTARARLRRLLHRIETAVGPRVFEADRHGIRWAPTIAVSVDALAFEDACDRGDFEDAVRTYSEIVEFDARTLKLLRRFPLAPGEEPTGLAFDAKQRRLFSTCANRKLVISDADICRHFRAVEVDIAQ